MPGSRFEVSTVFTADDLVSGKVRRMGRDVDKFSKRGQTSLKSINAGVNKFGRSMFNATKTVAIGGAVAAGAFWKLTESARDFDVGISRVAAAMGKSKSEVSELRDLALEMGRTTKFTATEAAGGLEQLAKAGFKSHQIMDALPAVLAGAAAGDIEMSRAAEIASSNLAAFGLEADQTQNIMDTLALVSTKTKTDFDSLQQSLQNAAPTAKALGFTFKQTAIMTSLLQDAGIDASEAGSSIKTMFNKLAAPNKKAQVMMKKAGVTFTDEYGNMLPPTSLFYNLEKLGASFEGNADKVAAFSEAVGLRGQKAALLLADAMASGKFGKLQKEMSDVTGAAQKMADTKLDNLAGDVTKLGSAWDGLIQDLGKGNDAPLRKLVKQLTKFLETPEVKEFILNFAESANSFFTWMAEPENQAAMRYWIGKMIDFGKVVLAFVAILKIATAAQWLYNFAVMANPYVLIAAAILALGALLYVFWPEITEFSKNVWADFAYFFEDVWKGLVGLSNGIAEDLKLAFSNPIQFMINKVTDLLLLMSKVPKIGKFAQKALDTMQAKGLQRSEDRGVSGIAVDAADRVTGNPFSSRAEVTIKSDAGTPVVTKKPKGGALTLSTSGGF